MCGLLLHHSYNFFVSLKLENVKSWRKVPSKGVWGHSQPSSAPISFSANSSTGNCHCFRFSWSKVLAFVAIAQTVSKGCASKFNGQAKWTEPLGRWILKWLVGNLQPTPHGLSAGISRRALRAGEVGLRTERQFVSARWEPQRPAKKETDRFAYKDRVNYKQWENICNAWPRVTAPNTHRYDKLI